MRKLTVKHLTTEEIAKCNSLLNNSGSVNSCSYQSAHKMVMEFVNSKEALIIAKRTVEEFKNNAGLQQQLAGRLFRAQERFNAASAAFCW